MKCRILFVFMIFLVVSYAGEPPQCSVCRKFGHRASDCPLSGLSGHLARECM